VRQFVTLERQPGHLGEKRDITFSQFGRGRVGWAIAGRRDTLRWRRKNYVGCIAAEIRGCGPDFRRRDWGETTYEPPGCLAAKAVVAWPLRRYYRDSLTRFAGVESSHTRRNQVNTLGFDVREL